MKNKIIFIILVLFSFQTLFGCVQNIDTYSGGSGIYFVGRGTDTLYHEWVLLSSDIKEKTIDIPVRIIGKPADYDRSFTIEYGEVDKRNKDEEATVNVDYLPFKLDYVMPAGKVEVNIPITLKRNKVLLEGVSMKVFTIRLVENSEFKFLYNRTSVGRKPYINDTLIYTRYIDTYRSIKMTELVEKQGWWKDNHLDFGTWSPKKSMLICDLMKWNRADWLSGNLTVISPGMLIYAGRAVQKYLNEQEANGNIIYEEPVDGKDPLPMVMGSRAQK